MDHDASGRQVNQQNTAKTSANEPSLGFFEQLGQFFRRNMYLFLIVGFALLLLQDVFGTHGVLAMRESEKQAQEIRKDIKRLDDENQRMQDRVKALKSDPAAIEKIAREEMKLSRPSEVIFQTQPKPASELQNPASHPDSPAKQP
ncbi:MAG: septum formation initiator family protein [Candidatus Acidiferrales bacterium]